MNELEEAMGELEEANARADEAEEENEAAQGRIIALEDEILELKNEDPAEAYERYRDRFARAGFLLPPFAALDSYEQDAWRMAVSR